MAGAGAAFHSPLRNGAGALVTEGGSGIGRAATAFVEKRPPHFQGR